MIERYNGRLVLLSVVVAFVASSVALDLGSRITAWRGNKAARVWLGGDAVSMGSGIWAMHFVGMLAFALPVEVPYDVWLTLLSLLLPVLVSGLALYTVSRRTTATRRLLFVRTVVGLGIVLMHDMGMAAMRMDPPIRYEAMLPHPGYRSARNERSATADAAPAERLPDFHRLPDRAGRWRWTITLARH
jgi:NO-binding membrane sensor protein with MHYT domain